MFSHLIFVWALVIYGLPASLYVYMYVIIWWDGDIFFPSARSHVDKKEVKMQPCIDLSIKILNGSSAMVKTEYLRVLLLSFFGFVVQYQVFCHLGIFYMPWFHFIVNFMFSFLFLRTAWMEIVNSFMISLNIYLYTNVK